MSDQNKSRDDLLKELVLLRRQVREMAKPAETDFSSHLLSLAVETSPSIAMITDAAGKIEYVNPRFTEVTGYAANEVISRNAAELGGQDPDELRQMWSVLESAETWRGEFHNRKKDGSHYVEAAAISALKNRDGKITHYVKVADDITSAKQAERMLAESELRYRTLLETISDVIFTVDRNGTFLFMNEFVARQLGGRPEDFVGQTQWDIFPKAIADRQMDAIRSVIDTGETETFDNTTMVNEVERFYHTIIHPIKSVGGDVVAVMGVARDLTDMVRTREALQRSKEQYGRLLENLPVGVFQARLDGKLLSANPALARMYGYDSLSDYLAVPVQDSCCDLNQWKKILTQLRAQGFLSDFEIKMKRKNGAHIWVSINAHAAFDPDGNLTHFDGVEIDVTDRVHAETALRKSGETVRALLNAPTQALFLIDYEGIILTLNEAAASRFNRSVEELVGTNVYDLLPPELAEARRERGREVFRIGRPLHFTDQRGNMVLNNQLYPVFGVDGKVEALAAYSLDITDKVKSKEALRASEMKYRNLFENAMVGMFQATLDGSRFLAANQKMADILGYTVEELLTKSPRFRWVDPIKRDRMIVKLKHLGHLENYEHQILTKHGEVRDVQASIRIFPDDDFIEGTLIDITDRTRAENALRSSQASLSALLESTDDFILLADRDGCPVFFNASYAKVMKELLGIEMKPGLKPHTLLPDLAQREVWEGYHRRVLTGEKFTVEHSFEDPVSVTRYFESTYNPILEGTEIVGFSEFTHEITQRKRAEQAIRASQANLLSILENTNDLIMLCGKNSRIVYMNSAFADVVEDLIGIDIEPGNNLNEKLPDGERQIWEELYRRALSGERFIHEFSWVAVNGKTRYFRTWFNPIWSDDEVQGFSQFTHDVTERRKMEEERRESEERFRRITERSFDAILIADTKGKLSYASPATKAVLGYEPGKVLGRNISEFVNSHNLPDVARGFAEIAQGRSVEGMQIEMIGSNGEIVFVEVNSTPVFKEERIVGSQAIIRDITARKRAEEMLERSYEEQSKHLRQVAGGLAHDIYNDLFPVTASLYKLKQRLEKSKTPDRSRDIKLVDLMDKAVDRAIDLTESVSLYSKLEKSEGAESANLAAVMDDILTQNDDRITTLNVSLDIRVPRAINVICQESQVFHMFNNLLLNALDALREMPTRQISIIARKKNDKILIEVHNSGKAIPPDHLPNVFDPFYSTKPLTGTGLGLAIVKRIVGLCQGSIRVESSLDKGTTFIIQMPGDVGT